MTRHFHPNLLSRIILILAASLAIAAFANGCSDEFAALAHSGGLAADGCHKDNAAGERHWHREGTRDRGGECVKRGDETFRYLAAPPPVSSKECVALKTQFEFASEVWFDAPAWSEEERNSSIRAIKAANDAVDAGCFP